MNSSLAEFYPTAERGGGGMLRTLRRSKLLFTAPILLAIGVGWFLAQHLPRRYTAEAVLALDTRRAPSVAGEVSQGLPQDNAALRTELDIITSRSVAEHVIDRLKLDADPLALREIRSDPVLAQIARSMAERIGIDLDDTAIGRSLGLGSAGWQPNRSDIADWILGNLKATNDGRSFTMYVAFTSDDPMRAAAVANAVAWTYLDDQVERKDTLTRRTAERLQQKLGEMSEAAAASDAAVTSFRQSAGLMEAKGTTVAGQQLSEINTQLAIARAERARVEGKLQMARGSGANSLPDVLSSPTIQALRAQVAKAEVAVRDNERNFYLLRDLRSTADSLRGQLNAETGRIVASLAHEAAAARAREASLSADLDQLRSDYGESSSRTVRLNQLQREADASKSVYQTFLARLKTMIEHEGLAMPDALLITEAHPPSRAIFPKPMPVLLISGLIGTLMGGVGVAMRSSLDGRIQDIGQLDAVAGVPILGVLPDWEAGVLSMSWPRSLRQPGEGLVVALQWLRAAVSRSRPPHLANVVVVTSSMAGEGKTSLCVSWARELRRAGERVLVIDADPYRPSVAKAFGATAERFAVVAPDADDAFLESAQTDILSGAEFVSAICPGSSPHVLRHDLFARQLSRAREHYDTIIIDTAPVVAGADAALLGKLANARLLVVRCGRTPWDQMLASIAAMRQCGSAIDGLVVVNADRRQLYDRSAPYAVIDGSGQLLVEHGKH
jgi:succinoglycan biosynthesis transport protein ExoP